MHYYTDIGLYGSVVVSLRDAKNKVLLATRGAKI
jgi:hypothetical protein